MLRLLKYLKPYLFLILLAIALLFVQANADLALPDYMSKIVNIGIQQGGVENAIPVAVRQTSPWWIKTHQFTWPMSSCTLTLLKNQFIS
jgi:ABC-type multidrug transport system fused ATPase/permease subunit